jgi:hypothetical protein
VEFPSLDGIPIGLAAQQQVAGFFAFGGLTAGPQYVPVGEGARKVRPKRSRRLK